MEIGVIGFGYNILNLVQRASNAGFTIYMNNPYCNHSLMDIATTNENIKLVGILEASTPKIVLLFIPFEYIDTILGQLPDMTGKIILHTGNPIFNTSSVNAEISGKSAAQKIAQLLPKSNIVKLYHEIQTVSYTDHRSDNSKPKIYFSGENLEAKKEIKSLLDLLNFSGIDLTNKIYLNYL